jgi:uncharacterized FlaG/YvyC family protein
MTISWIPRASRRMMPTSFNISLLKPAHAHRLSGIGSSFRGNGRSGITRSKADISNERELVDIRLKDFADRLNDFGSNSGKRLDDVVESLGNRLGDFGNRIDQFAMRLLSHDRVHLFFFATLLSVFGGTYKLFLDVNKKIDGSSEDMNIKIETLSKEVNHKVDASSKELNEKIDTLSKEVNHKVDASSKEVHNLSKEFSKEMRALGTKIDQLNSLHLKKDDR